MLAEPPRPDIVLGTVLIVFDTSWGFACNHLALAPQASGLKIDRVRRLDSMISIMTHLEHTSNEAGACWLT